MISPYVAAARLAQQLDLTAAAQLGYTLPASGTAIQRRMGQNIFACAGVSIGVTNVQAAPAPPNCPPDVRYSIDAGIARTCAVEFNTDGQTLNPQADAIAQQMSADAAVLWAAFSTVTNALPLTVFQITGGLAIVSATFTIGEFDLVSMSAAEGEPASAALVT